MEHHLPLVVPELQVERWWTMFSELTHDDVFRLETRRLWLRWPTHADVPAVQAIAANRDVAVMTATWPHPLPDGEAARRISQMREANAEGRSLMLALARKSAPSQVIGLVGVAMARERAQLGYFLTPELWRQGYMTEALAQIVDASFRLSNAEVMKAACFIDNAGSRRVLGKCGFSALGVHDCKAPARSAEAMPAEHFELTRSDWDARFGRLAA